MVETGTHLEQGGLRAQLWRRQSDGFLGEAMRDSLQAAE